MKSVSAKMNFLGFLVNGDEIKPSPKNVQKLLNIPEPKTKKQIERLLGVANFIRRFIPGYATICKPLTHILSDPVKFEWGKSKRKHLLI